MSELLGPRKRRTWQHVIADLSVHFVERFILEEGHTSQRLGADYGYDLILWTFDKQGYPEPGSVYFQFKARQTLVEVKGGFVYSLEVRDYNLWMWERTPVILILFDATRRRAYWVCVQQYFHDHPDRGPIKGAKTIQIRVSKRQRVGLAAIRTIRELKERAQSPYLGIHR